MYISKAKFKLNWFKGANDWVHAYCAYNVRMHGLATGTRTHNLVADTGGGGGRGGVLFQGLDPHPRT